MSSIRWEWRTHTGLAIYAKLTVTQPGKLRKGETSGGRTATDEIFIDATRGAASDVAPSLQSAPAM